MKREQTDILITIFLLLCFRYGGAQEQEVRLYELEDWISFKNANYPTSLSVGYQYVYFGTNGGVLRFHKYGKYWEEPFTTSNGMATDRITAIVFDPTTNYIWVAHEHGVSYLSPSAENWENVANNEFAPGIKRLGYGSGSIWVQLQDGAYLTLNKQLGDFQEYREEVSEFVRWGQSQHDQLPDFSDYFLNADFRFEPPGNIIDTDFREYPINLFFTDVNQDIYGSARGLGIIEGDQNSKRLTVRPFGPLNNRINALAQYDDQIWVGGIDSGMNPVQRRTGISIFNKNDLTWRYAESYLTPEIRTTNILEIIYGKSRFWIGTDQGLTIYNPHKRRWRRYHIAKGLFDEIITTIGVSDTVAWIGTPLGLSKISLPKFKISRVYLEPSKMHMRIFKIAVGPARIWVGTDNGLYSIEKGTHLVKHYGIHGDEIALDAAVAADFTAIGQSDSLLLFYRLDGMIKYDLSTETFEALPQFSFLSEALVYDIVVDRGFAWIGTSKGAVLIRLRDNYLEHYHKIDGLADYQVYRILPDKEVVWFGTDRGLTKYYWRKYAFMQK